MAHGNQIGSPLRRHDSGMPSHLQGIAFGVLGQRFQHLRPQNHESAGLSLALGRGFRGNIDHPGSARTIVMGELFGHWKNYLTRSDLRNELPRTWTSASPSRRFMKNQPMYRQF